MEATSGSVCKIPNYSGERGGKAIEKQGVFWSNTIIIVRWCGAG